MTWKFITRPLLLQLGLLATLPGIALSQTPAPTLFFSDLVNGPNSGGQGNNGAFVTLYGNYFGSNPAVTVGGGTAIVTAAPARYLWYQKMTIQLGANAQSGNIVVSNSNGVSNGLPFTVRPGSVYFVASYGSDSNAGSYTAPWRTLPHAVQATGARGCSLVNCEIAHLGNYGVWFERGCTDNAVTTSYIHDASAGGVRLGDVSGQRLLEASIEHFHTPAHPVQRAGLHVTQR